MDSPEKGYSDIEDVVKFARHNGYSSLYLYDGGQASGFKVKFEEAQQLFGYPVSYRVWEHRITILINSDQYDDRRGGIIEMYCDSNDSFSEFEKGNEVLVTGFDNLGNYHERERGQVRNVHEGAEQPLCIRFYNPEYREDLYDVRLWMEREGLEVTMNF